MKITLFLTTFIFLITYIDYLGVKSEENVASIQVVMHTYKKASLPSISFEPKSGCRGRYFNTSICRNDLN